MSVALLTLTTSKGDVTIAPVMPPTLFISALSTACLVIPHPPATKCFHGATTLLTGFDDDAACDGASEDVAVAIVAILCMIFLDKTVETSCSCL